LHVWSRDRLAPGDYSYEPGRTDDDRKLEEFLRGSAPDAFATLRTQKPTRKGQLVLDVIVVEPNLWWVGFHRAGDLPTRRPGGLFDEIVMPYEAVSRAYLKMEEALRWSRMPVRQREHAVEIGCAPGGSCQALLLRGLAVTGIDPAEMHPAVLGHPRFTHIQKRGADVKRREFRNVKWLATDMNVAPQYTLDTVEAIVKHDEVDIEGLILTLKLLDWEQADHVEDYVARVQSWGYEHVHCRQLQHNRREFCLTARRSSETADDES